MLMFDLEKFKLELRQMLEKTLDDSSSISLNVEYKADLSPLTRIDIFVSDWFESSMSKEILEKVTFISEEGPKELHFPCVVLDPIDGTRELVAGIPECAVSLAYLNSSDIRDPKNEAWIYNPFTAMEISTSQQRSFFKRSKTIAPSRGLISRTEWKNKLTRPPSQEVILAPMGSIAFKLGLLAQGACDFVITKRPKSLWDIAAGAVLCERYGLLFRNEKEEMRTLNSLRFEGPMIWWRPGSLSSEDLMKLLHN